LLGRRFKPRGSLVNLLGIGPRPFFAQLLGLLGRIIQLFGHRLQVRANGVDVLHFLLGLEVAQWLLDVFLDALSE
jgi:hypothetical protein